MNARNSCLKLAPYIGDGNVLFIVIIAKFIVLFETSPVYRGRKQSFDGQYTTLQRFETSPVYRGRKLSHDLIIFSRYLISLKLAPYIGDGNPPPP